MEFAFHNILARHVTEVYRLHLLCINASSVCYTPPGFKKSCNRVTQFFRLTASANGRELCFVVHAASIADISYSPARSSPVMLFYRYNHLSDILRTHRNGLSKQSWRTQVSGFVPGFLSQFCSHSNASLDVAIPSPFT